VCEEGAVVFCRATPEDKSTLLQALQRQGHVVAVRPEAPHLSHEVMSLWV
jgi:hypothetical protein